MDAMNKRASVAVMSMEAKKLVQQDPRRSEDEAILASLEAGRALSPLIPSVHEAAPGRGEGDGVACQDLLLTKHIPKNSLSKSLIHMRCLWQLRFKLVEKNYFESHSIAMVISNSKALEKKIFVRLSFLTNPMSPFSVPYHYPTTPKQFIVPPSQPETVYG